MTRAPAASGQHGPGILRTVFTSVVAGALSSMLAAQRLPVILVNNGPGDDTDDLQAALDLAGSGPATVRFLTGQQYDFYPPLVYPGYDVGWVHLEDAHDIEIAGDNALLVLHDFDPNKVQGSAGSYPTRFFGFENLNGLDLHDLSVEMSREPYSSGVITAKGQEPFPWVDIRLEQDYPDLNSNFQIQTVGDFDPDPASRRLKGHQFNMALQHGWYTAVITRTGPPAKPTVRLASTCATGCTPDRAWVNYVLGNAAVGNGAALMHGKYRCHFLLVKDCSDLVVSDVTIHDMPGMGILAFNTHDITLTNFDIRQPLPPTERLFSATADGVHLQDCTGAVLLDGCDFSRMGDDGFNSGGKFLEVSRVLEVVGGPAYVYFDEVPGQPYWLLAWSTAPQEIEFYSPRLARRGSRRITNFRISPDPAFGQYWGTFTSGIPGGVKSGDLVGNPDKLPASITIQACSVEDNIGCGVTLHGRHAAVDDCVFRRNGGPAVLVQAELISFYESTPAIDVAITDCTIEDSNRYMWSLLGAITTLGEYLDAGGQRVIAGAGLHKDILIQGNSFSGLRDETIFPRGRRVAIWVSASDDVDILDNTFTNIGAVHPSGGRTVGIARVENATDVTSNGLNCVEATYRETGARPAFTLINTLFRPALEPDCPACGAILAGCNQAW